MVDLDGTLIRSDLLLESFFSLLAKSPLQALVAFTRLLRGKAALKTYLADHATLDIDNIPLDGTVLAYVRAERERGRPIYLASASDHRYVEALAQRTGLFDGSFGTTMERNLSGTTKAQLLCDEFGEKGFDYLGNDRKDLNVWKFCRQAIVANATDGLLRRIRRNGRDPLALPRTTVSFRTYLSAFRVHHWIKNVLVFAPLLAGHVITVQTLSSAALAAIAFSLAASSAYLLNDLLDLPHDRTHASKRFRPLASGAMPLMRGVSSAVLLLIVAALIGIALPFRFLGFLAIYFAGTVAYSVGLKQLLLIDVMTLAGLYTLRVIAGGAVSQVPLSPWFLAFSTFFFLCLALIKRYIELIGRLKRQAGNPSGRSYTLDDLPILSSLAAASGYGAVLVLALYFHSPEVHALYHAPELLWLTCPPLLYWISRLLMLAHRGLLDDDPVVYTATDKISWVVGGVILAIVLVAI